MRAIAILFGLAVAAPPTFAADWWHWRGPHGNGVSDDKDIPDKFKVEKAGDDNLAWTAPYGCRSTPLYLNGRLYFNSRTGDKDINTQESVVCLDATDGKLVWEKKFNVWHTDIVANRVGWTNLCADPDTGNIYCHGTQGLLTCFDADGKEKWSRSLGEEFGRVSGYGGRITSPVVDGDLVIIGMACAAWGEYGRGGCRFVAFDKKGGKIVWWASTGFRVLDTFMSTPVVAEIGGQRLLVSGGADGGVHAFKVRTGEKVWSHIFCSGAVNATPLVKGDLVIAAHGDVNPDNAEKHGRVVCLDGATVKDGKPKLVWQVDGPKIKFATPVLDGDRVILNDEDARLHCLSLKDGKQLWKFKYGGGANVRNSPVLCNGKIYVGDGASRFHVIDVSGKTPKKVQSLTLQSTTPGVDAELDGSPSIANGCLFFASNEAIYCVSKDKPKRPDPSSTAWKGDPAPPNAKPAHLQVFPADVTLGPGESASFTARLYDEKGRLIKEEKAKWTLGPMLPVESVAGLPPPPAINPPPLKGELSDDGKLTMPADGPAQFGNVVATVGELKGHARVRLYSKLPVKQDFDKVPVGASPAGWVNTQVKFQVRKVGEETVLVKTATNPSPLVAQANAFLGPHTMSDYTIESDVLGTAVGGEQPDMAVVAQRYTFGLFGATQQLRLTSWDALPRIDRSTAFAWKPNVWFRLKLQVAVADGKATVRGKVWERGKEEPEKWSLEVVDPLPNAEGAPALYASVPPKTIGGPMKPGAEAYFDNVSVTPNKPNGKGAAPKKDKPQAEALVVVPCDDAPASRCSAPASAMILGPLQGEEP